MKLCHRPIFKNSIVYFQSVWIWAAYSLCYYADVFFPKKRFNTLLWYKMNYAEKWLHHHQICFLSMKWEKSPVSMYTCAFFVTLMIAILPDLLPDMQPQIINEWVNWFLFFIGTASNKTFSKTSFLINADSWTINECHLLIHTQ